MSFISCKKCGAKVSDQYSFCTNCQAPINAKMRASDTQVTSELFDKQGRKRKIPSESRNGASVGAFVGFIQGITSAANFVAISPLTKSAVTEQLAQESPIALRLLPTIWNLVMVIAIVGSPVMGAILGCVLGVLFVAFRKRIPGTSIIRKSVIFSLILVAISVATSAIGQIRYLLYPAYRSLALTGLALTGLAIVVIEYPILGFIFGYLLSRSLRNMKQ